MDSKAALDEIDLFLKESALISEATKDGTPAFLALQRSEYHQRWLELHPPDAQRVRLQEMED